MKIAMLTSSCDEREKEEGFIVNWIKTLGKHVDELVVITLTKQKTPIKLTNVKVVSLDDKTSKLEKIRFLLSLFYREHRQKHFDGIFSHMYDFLGLTAGLLGKLFAVKSVFWYAWGGGLTDKNIARLALELNSDIVTCSQSLKSRYRREFRIKTPIHVFGHAIPVKRFVSRRRKMGKVFSIGVVGRLAPNKNIETLIQACQNLRTERPIELKLVLTRLKSHPEYAKRLQKTIRNARSENLKIVVLKDVPYQKMPWVYHSLHLYVHSGRIRSMDKAGLEAICSGTPVLLSNHGYRELMRGIPEALFDPDDPTTLARKIRSAISNYERFSARQERLRDLVRRKYSTDAFMKKLVSLY